ncbi:MAG: cysteine--tRNA ligase [Mycobacteriales bacterium]
MALADIRAGVVHIGGGPLPLLDRARLYVCGVTPYDVTHLGHAATFVWVDTLARVITMTGARAEICRNVTDVDDVLTEAARRAGVHYDRFAALAQYGFERDMAALAVRRPEHEPRAHNYVAQVIALVKALVDSDAAYQAAGWVYFPGAQVVRRAGLPEARALELLAEYGDRADEPGKREPFDVAIWRASDPSAPAWDSPWGPGRPGWHAECAAMAVSILGPAMDVHCGGGDLRFPHHAYESALAVAFTGVAPFARRWMRPGVVGVAGVKMSKSLGNLVLVSQLLQSYPPAVVRLMILDRPWDADWDYEATMPGAAAVRLEGLYSAAGRPGSDEVAVRAVRTALLAELDVAGALDVAVEAGGAAARLVVDTLALS